MTDAPSVDGAVRMMRLGVCDYFAKPASTDRLREAAQRLSAARSLSAVSRGLLEVRPLAEVESLLIAGALTYNKGAVAKTARMLGIGRATIYRKLTEMGWESKSRRPV